MNDSPKIKFAFFGTPKLSAIVLDRLQEKGLVPSLIVTAPDKPQGRGLQLAPSPVKIWAEKNNIAFLQPAKLRDESFLAEISKEQWDLFVVAAYGKIIPQNILDLAKRGTLNVHPSLLPKYRGPSPIESAILADEATTGVSIMLLDAEMDHGPVLMQEKILLEPMPSAPELEEKLADIGGKLLAEALPKWIAGEIKAHEQDHDAATVCKKISKEMGLVNLENDQPREIFLKFKAFQPWPNTYFFAERKGKQIRVIIKAADFAGGKLSIRKVVPEGGKEMSYEDFLRGN